MAEPKMTRKPCPGCGKTSQHLRTANTVCYGCRTLIEEAKTRRSEILAIGGIEPVSIPKDNHQCPGYSPPEQRRLKETEQHMDELRDAMVALGRILGWKAPQGNWTPEERRLYRHKEFGRYGKWGSPYGEHSKRFLVESEVIDAMVRLDNAIQRGLDHSFYEGKHRGQSLMRGLASGEFTVDDFNERSAKIRDDDY